MVDYQTLSIVLTGIGMIIALTYYGLQIRNQNKTRQAQLYMQIFSQLNSTDKWREYLEILLELEWDDYIDFQKKHGVGNLDTYAKINALWWNFTTVGNLLLDNLIDRKQVYNLLGPMAIDQWNKWEPIIVALRKRIETPEAYSSFEYLAREMRKLKDEGYAERLIESRFSLK